MSYKTEAFYTQSRARVAHENRDFRRGRRIYQPTLISSTGKPVEWATLRKFESRLLGEILHPAEERYQSARRAWNGVLDERHPGIIVRCAAAVDVIRAVDFARSNELEIAVRAGGHSMARDSFRDGGMVIDVSDMKAIRVDRQRQVAYADAGLTVGEFDRTTLAVGLASVMGECSSVGIAGYTIGGGLGRLMGQYGAACDNLLSAELVTADGEVSRASADENPDLFWAIRGGGGNFGIVTALEYQLHPIEQVLSGTLRYPISDLRAVLTFLDEFMMEIPDELDMVIDIGNPGWMGGHAEPVVNLTVSYLGDIDKGEAALRPLRLFGNPVDGIKAMSYLEMQERVDLQPLIAFGADGGSMAIRGGFVERVGAEAIDTIEAFVKEAPTCFWITAEHYLHGEVLRRAPDHTAFALRRPGYTTRVFSAWREAQEAEASVIWVERLGAALKSFAGGTTYVNYMSAETGNADTRGAYGANYERLADLKSRYDPANFFNSNRNIPPLALKQ